MFKVGDRVKVVDTDAVYSRYLRYLADIAYYLNSEDIAKFKFDAKPEKNEELKVVRVGRHPECYKEEIYICVNSKHLFIMNGEGLVPISSITQGSIVRCIDTAKVYTNYSEFMIEHYKELRKENHFDDSLFWAYAYKRSPAQNKDEEHLYEVLLVAPHTEAWAEERLLAICQDKVTGLVYIFNLDALEVVQ